MNVPITSDLAGYQAYWTRVLYALAACAVVIMVELGAMLWLLWHSTKR